LIRRQRIYFYILCIAVLTILLALSQSTDNYVIPKAVAQTDNLGRTTSPAQFGQSAIESVYTSIIGPNTSAHNSTNLNKGTGSPRNQTNNPESLIGSFLDPKVLLASAIDQIRNSTANSVSSNQSKTNSTAMFVRNYEMLLLARQIIPPKDFIPLFDDPSYNVIEGQVTTKLPCNSNSTSPLKIFIAKISVGQTPVLNLVQLQLVSGLSKPGYMCVYHVNLPYITSTNTTGASYGVNGNNTNMAISGAKNNLTIVDIALINPTDHVIMLPDTSSISIGFNEIMPSAHRHPYNKSLA
jgi:hypothetical protein